jgi:NADH dehydrogenase FAD-containing subunit
MAFDTIRLLVKYLPVILQFASQLLVQRVRAVIHRFTYVQTTNPKHVIVIGGSFAGIHLGKRLAETLHSGYKVILVERNSHFNYTFNFPRYSVVRGREGKAFIPYDGIEKGKPKGAFEFVSGAVIEIRDTDILMEDGRTIEYEFLAIATGVTQSPPAKLLGTQKHEACSELQALQDRIFDSKTIAIVGAGAVGVQLACDIKTFYPDKSVTLIHSRKQLLPSWGYKLHAYVLEKLQELKIEVLLGERPKLTPVSNWQAEELSFSDGSKRRFDLIVSLSDSSLRAFDSCG